LAETAARAASILLFDISRIPAYTRALLDAAPGREWDFASFRPVVHEVAAML
jgi:hypothetical protein